MDILNVISEQTTSVALAVVIMWFYNKLVLDFLAERKEMIDALRTERKEWIMKSDLYLNQLFEINRQSVEGLSLVRSEMHALKGRVTELLLSFGKGSLKDDRE